MGKDTTIEICALASGSNGNCYYIGNSVDAILVDAGISAKQILLRMEDRELNPSKIRGLFITHEHTDHARGARVLAKRLNIPVYITTGTYQSIQPADRPEHVVFFSPGEQIRAGEFCIHSFTKKHDAAEPCSFRIEYANKQIGVFTDIGEACEEVRTHLSKCHAIFIETNYDEQMLWNGPYPYPLKRRVASEYGHLSNDQAFNLINSYSGNQLQCLFLSHLSKENNTPEKALNSFSKLESNIKVILTDREGPTAVLVL